jgi:hypothetical protein
MQVNLCENYKATQQIKHVIKPRNGMMISNSNIINGSTIHTHIRQEPSFLGTKIIGTAQGLRLSHMYPRSKSSWTCR